ncbi:MAG: hypothetical protein QOH48_1251 [Actinomycetota bacterium]|jgi:hypothetical protein|nr:hypothetical protein [Actinomycetota bacterium]
MQPGTAAAGGDDPGHRPVGGEVKDGTVRPEGRGRIGLAEDLLGRPCPQLSEVPVRVPWSLGQEPGPLPAPVRASSLPAAGEINR